MNELVMFIVGLFILIQGSDYFVKAASGIAEKFGISDFLIGLTLVAVGTSVAEISSSVAAALKGSSGIVIGNVIGSNAANLCLIIGIAAIIKAIKTNEQILERDGLIMLAFTCVMYIFSFNQVISRWEAFVFILLYAIYIMFLNEKREEYRPYKLGTFVSYILKFGYLGSIRQILKSNGEKKQVREAKFMIRLVRDFAFVIFGVFLIVVGADILIDTAISIAGRFGIPETLIGITLVALGTSLPELSVTLVASLKGYGDIALGNIIGSNIANILLVLGVSAFIQPLTVLSGTLHFAMPLLLLITLLFVYFIRREWNITRNEGIILILIYVAFIALNLIFVS